MKACSFAYPTETKAIEAGACLHEMADAGTLDADCAQHCLWVAQGYLLSQGCPCCEATLAGSTAPQLADLAAASAPCCDTAPGKMKAIDWVALFKQVVAILQVILPLLPVTPPTK